jgi:hypothetical protein
VRGILGKFRWFKFSDGVPEDQPHAKQIAYAPQPPMWGANEEREPVPIARDAERPVPCTPR